MFKSDKPPPPRPVRPTNSSVKRPATRSPTTTQAAYARHASGSRAEQAAANYFEHIGYSILDRNLHVGRAEIDLLVQQDDVVVVVEVRTRGAGSYQRALDSITSAKQKRLRAAGETLWRRRFLKDKRIATMRFDAVAVAFDAEGQPSIEHIRAAF
ncbi:MAG TPA: YraN family protein [Polyangium sp.]|nr:YraN family protein [Polyangium sp.]